jgi:hypothetical protein
MGITVGVKVVLDAVMKKIPCPRPEYAELSRRYGKKGYIKKSNNI